MKTQLQQLKQKASSVGAIIDCPKCDFDEDFENYLDRDNMVSEESETVHWGCPECGSDTVDLAKKRDNSRNVVVVNGLEELEGL